MKKVFFKSLLFLKYFQKMKDLQHVISIMEHLGDHLDDTAEYLEILHSLLRLCLSPPILERASEGLFRLKALQEFFTVLGIYKLKANLNLLNTTRIFFFIHLGLSNESQHCTKYRK